MVPVLAAGILTIIAHGKPLVPIVARGPDQFAGRQLALAIERMTGTAPPVVESAPRERILVRTTGRGADDGFRIRSDERGLVIEGHSVPGTIYGTYYFLRKYLGCYFLFSGELGEVYPHPDTVRVPPIDVEETPAFTLRAFALNRSGDAPLWGLRNGINGIYANDFATQHGWPVSFQPEARGFHGFEAVLPAEKYFARFPEIFPLLGGQRRPYSFRSGQLCTTNPQSVELCAQVVLKYFEQHPDAKAFTLSPNDGYGWCECDNCREFDRRYGGDRKWRGSDTPVTTDRLIYFLNQVAERLKERYPDKKLFTLSYVNYVEPPLTFKPAENVIVFQCHYAPACYGHAVNDPSCPDNREFDAHLRRWLKVAPNNLGIYAYTDKSMWLGLPRPVVRQMAADIKHYYSLGVRYYYAQSAASAWEQALPLYYVTARLLWNPGEDVDALLTEFWTAGFGQAADSMRRFYETFERSVQKQGAHYSDSPKAQAAQFIRPDVISEAWEHLRTAEQLAERTDVRERIEAVKEWFTRSSELGELLYLYNEYGKTGDESLIEPMRKLYTRQAKRWGKGSYGARQLEEIGAVAAAPGTVIWSGFGDPETLGGRTCRNSDETGPGDNANGWATFIFILDNRDEPVRLRLTVWGRSQLSSLLICKEGRGKGRAAGGVWVPLEIHPSLSGKEQWDEVVVDIPPELFDKSTRRQLIGFGGGDSQVWIADVVVETPAGKR